MNLNTVFLREDCILPDHFDLCEEPFCKGWSATIGVHASELDASIRSAGWHFMWMTDSYSSRSLGRTRETAIHRAVAGALKKVKGRFNAAELGSLRIVNCLGIHLAKVTLDSRQIQKHPSLAMAVESRLQEVLTL